MAKHPCDARHHTLQDTDDMHFAYRGPLSLDRAATPGGHLVFQGRRCVLEFAVVFDGGAHPVLLKRPHGWKEIKRGMFRYQEQPAGCGRSSSEEHRMSLRRSIGGLGPYQSLFLLALPTATVEPLKLVAVAWQERATGSRGRR